MPESKHGVAARLGPRSFARWFLDRSAGVESRKATREIRPPFDWLGVRVWQQLLALLDAEGKLDLKEGSLDGSFVPAKRGVKPSPGATKAKLHSDDGE